MRTDDLWDYGDARLIQKARPPLLGKAGSIGAISVGARSTWRKKD